MVKNTYGKTAWGQAFLDALSRLDYDKRMDRGKTYANTGKVQHMVIEDPCRVKASVIGSDAYRVTVVFSPLSIENKQAICDTIEENILILGKILFGELPDELLLLLGQAGIALLPHSWNDIRADCSCPDYANPCKHMAAVYFHLTTHIDQDPFTLFRLRGLNLLAHFGIKQADTNPGYPLSAEKLGLPPPESCSESLGVRHCEMVQIPDMSSFILDCLRSNPPYCLQLDFKEVMREFYRHAKNKGGHVLEDICQRRENHWSSDLDTDAVHRLLSHSLIIMPVKKEFTNQHLILYNEVLDAPASDSLAVFGSMPYSVQMIAVNHNSITSDQRWMKIDLLTAMQLFLMLNNGFGSPSYVWFHHAFRVLVSLINANAFIPDVLPTVLMPADSRVHTFKVIWKPLYTSEMVSAQLANLNKVFPEGYNAVNLDNEPLAAQSSALHFLTSLLTLYVHRLNFMHKKCKQNPPKESLAFFRGTPYQKMNANEDKTAKSIDKEFSVFDLVKLDFIITVRVDPLHVPSPSNGHEYSLSIRLRDKHVGSLQTGEVINAFLLSHPTLKPQVLKLLASLHPYLPQLTRLLTAPHVPLSHGQLEQFVLDSAAIFTNLGVEVVMAKELKELLRPDSVVLASAIEELEQFPDKYRTFMSLGDLLKFDWKICLGKDMVDYAEFERLVASGRKLVRYKDKFVVMEPGETKKLLASKPKKSAKHGSFEILREALTENTLMRFTSDVDSFIKGLIRVTDHKVPANLNAKLREYQITGYKWVLSNLLNGFGVVLADDMGLGKTIQTIAVLLQLKNMGRLQNSAFIVVPASVLSNWEREIKRFAPDLSVARYYGANRGAISGILKMVPGSSQEAVSVAINSQPQDDKAAAITKSYLEKALDKSSPGSLGSVKLEVEATSLPKMYGEDEDEDMELPSLASFIRPHIKPEVGCCVKTEPSVQSLGIDVKKEKLLSTDAGLSPPATLQDVTNSQVKQKIKGKNKKRPWSAGHKDQQPSKRSKTADILLTTFQTALRDVNLLARQEFDVCVVDEAQKIKNAQSQTSKALKCIKAPMRMALSGTPVENKLLELWSIFDFILPKYLGAPKEFGDTYAKPIEIRRDVGKAESLKKVTGPFMLRRLKTDRNVIRDLPDKVVENMYCTLTTEQTALYESKVQDVDSKLAELEDRKQRNMFIFELMLRLKQICNHPANLLSQKPKDIQSSGKMKMLIELLETIVSQGEKVLIFTQFVKMIHIMAEVIQKRFQMIPLIYHGEMSERKKDEAVQAFMTQTHSQIFIVSTRAGGVGLNLTAANHVVHYDLWYNPAVENQATDRAFRIGQRKNVFVYRFITEKTFEEKIDEMIQSKRELSEMTVATREQWLGHLSDQGIRDLFVRG